MIITPLTCPSCQSTSVEDEGPLPAFNQGVFGGRPSHVAIEPGHFIRCRECDLCFRYPTPSDEVLTSLYEELPDTIWESDEVRPYWSLTKSWLERYASNKKVLDVGCFTGDLLQWLPSQWEKFGVEPAKAASELAAKRGIKMLGKTTADLVEHKESFGGVISFDVIEHITKPMPFITSMRDSLAPGGCLILLTGATDSLPYRLFRRHYWYGSFPEHVSFFSLAWFEWVAEHLGMTIVAHRYLTCEKRNWRLWCKQLVQTVIQTSIRLLRERGVSEAWLEKLPLLGRATRWATVPWWRQATDHIMVVLKKN